MSLCLPLLLALSFLPADDVDADKAKVEAFIKKARRAELEKAIAGIAETRKKLDSPEVKKSAKRVADLKRALASMQERTKQIRDHFEPTIQPNRFQVGDIGFLKSGLPPEPLGLKVLQVIDDENMLVTWGDSLFWLSGISTKRVVDKESIGISGLMKVAGTKRYTNALKTTRTVFLVEPAPGKDLPDPKSEEAPLPTLDDADAKRKAEAAAKSKPEESETSREEAAAAKLKTAKKFLEMFGKEAAVEKLDELLDKYPGTKACEEAKELRKKLTGK